MTSIDTSISEKAEPPKKFNKFKIHYRMPFVNINNSCYTENYLFHKEDKSIRILTPQVVQEELAVALDVQRYCNYHPHLYSS